MAWPQACLKPIRTSLTLREKCPNTELLLVLIFVLGLNTGKYGPEIIPFLGHFSGSFGLLVAN